MPFEGTAQAELLAQVVHPDYVVYVEACHFGWKVLVFGFLGVVLSGWGRRKMCF